jgi:hypothetical protein
VVALHPRFPQFVFSRPENQLPVSSVESTSYKPVVLRPFPGAYHIVCSERLHTVAFFKNLSWSVSLGLQQVN